MKRGLGPGMRVTDLERPADGATSAMWGKAEVLVKRCELHPKVVANEFVANRLALLFSVPVPLGDIWFSDDGVLHWVCAAIRRRGVEFPPPSPETLAGVDEVLRARIVVFDAWILNIDRHDDNILCDTDGRVWLIDHDQALFRNAERDAATAIIGDIERRGFGVSVIAEVAPPSASAIAQAVGDLRTLNQRSIDAITDGAHERRLVTRAEQRALARFLRSRRDNIGSLMPSRFPIGEDARYTEGMFGVGDTDGGAR